MDKDKVITDKVKYDDLLKKAKEREEEKKSKMIKLYVYKRTSQHISDRYAHPLENNWEYTINLSNGEQVPDTILEELREVIKIVTASQHIVEAKKYEIYKIQQKTEDLINDYKKQLKEIPNWKKWLLNIKTKEL